MMIEKVKEAIDQRQFGHLREMLRDVPAPDIAELLLNLVKPEPALRFRLDPAVVSNPLITSIADVVGLIIYFSIATRILGAWS